MLTVTDSLALRHIRAMLRAVDLGGGDDSCPRCGAPGRNGIVGVRVCTSDGCAESWRVGTTDALALALLADALEEVGDARAAGLRTPGLRVYRSPGDSLNFAGRFPAQRGGPVWAVTRSAAYLALATAQTEVAHD